MTTQTKKTLPAEWHGKPYYSLDAWCKNSLGRKCYKIALNAHMTCPNRDGSLDTRGCIFCSAGGSGDFAVDIAGKSVEEQLAEGLARFRAGKFLSSEAISPLSGPADPVPCLIAYFQAYTNTYAPVDYLRRIYTQALDCPWVCGISIATRPDCLSAPVLSLLSECQTAYPDKFIWIELGLQTIHPRTAQFIRRGYELSCFEEACSNLYQRKLPVIVHLILGLPGETESMMLQSIDYLNRLHPFGVKLQLLHILEGTDLGTLYLQQSDTPHTLRSRIPIIQSLDQESYIALLTGCIRRLAPDIVIHRLTGDGPKDILLAPLWSLDKRNVLNTLHHQMRLQKISQGDCYVTRPVDPV